MIRTIKLSYCALFGGLLLISPSLQPASAEEAPSQVAVSDGGAAADLVSPASSGNDGPALVTPDHEEEIDFGQNLIRLIAAPPIAISLDGDDPPEIADNEDSPTDELTPELKDVRDRLRRCLTYYYEHPENTADRSVWGVMHALIAYGVDTQVITTGRKVNAIGWVCYNGSCKGQRLFYLKDNKLQARIGPGVQGHPGQYLAMLAQSRVKTDFPLKVEGRDFTIADLIEMEKFTCDSKTELTFKLIGLVHYLDTDDTWKNHLGENWSLPRLIKEELAQPVIKGACGGTHRMMGFSYAIKKREREGKPMEGEWLRAKKFVDAYHEYTLSLQNKDGSMSTDYFKGRGDFGEAPRRLETTGHILEWLIYSLPEDRLRDPQVVKGIDYLTNLLSGNKTWEIGPKGHALHALMIYDQRVFGGKPGQFAPVVATSPAKTR